MNSMKITKYLHSCLLVEKDATSLLFDPGKFSFLEGMVRPEQFSSITAVILTHGHPDHLDLDALKIILKNNPGAKVLANSGTLDQLAQAGITANSIDDGHHVIGTLTLRALPTQHNPILSGTLPQNTAFLIDEVLLNPGDSFDPELYRFAGIDVLVVPVMAPWGNELQMMQFVEAMKPKAVVPVHDGQAKSFFIAQRYTAYAEEFQKRNIAFADLRLAGSSYTL